MVEHKKESMPPTVKRVLDEYITVLNADEKIENEAAERLDALLRKGKVPKLDEIDAALFPSPKGDKP